MNRECSSGRFQAMSLEPGITYYYLPDDKWKTLSLNIFCKVPMAKDMVTRIALVPRLARRGTVNLPSLRDLSRRLEDMYGAGLGADTSKIGPMQVVRFAMSLPSPEFVKGAADGVFSHGVNLGKAMSFIWEVASKPYLEDGAYPKDRFETEREEHRRDILSIINNRPRYATVRLVEEVSKGDPSGLPAWGTLEELNRIGPKDTWDAWTTTLSRSGISIYAIGKGVRELGDILARTRLDFPKARVAAEVGAEKRLSPPSPPKELLAVEEYLPGEQTILCMAFYTGITESDARLPAQIFFDGILGGFPHSKLFVNVREKEHLAYFADSSLNPWRGMVLTVAGVMDSFRDKARDLVSMQVEAMKKGDITEDEIENTRVGLLRRYRSESDSQAALVRRFLSTEILGGPATEEELVEQVMRVTKDDIVEVANCAQLKAVYTLRAKDD
ncbi:MAG: EF-P 5-aminopentanol modification-associated protein YfmF [Bacillota bacterium]